MTTGDERREAIEDCASAILALQKKADAFFEAASETDASNRWYYVSHGLADALDAIRSLLHADGGEKP